MIVQGEGRLFKVRVDIDNIQLCVTYLLIVRLVKYNMSYIPAQCRG